MEPADLVVRCMLRREGSVYVAVCIDLTLAAQGKTAAEAKHRLHAQIADYVRQAFTVDKRHAALLLTRKGPIGDRLLYRALQLASGLKRAIKRRLYSETLPVCPVAA